MNNNETFIKYAGKEFTSYRAFVECIEQFVLNVYDLQYDQNPIVKQLRLVSADDARHIIKEYSQFSNEAIHMLLDARIRVHEWKALAEEIDRNIEEEKGAATAGVPHLEIMRKGYLIGIDFDVNTHEPVLLTKNLLLDLRKIFRKKNNAHLAGALLAFESVSIPEFHVLETLVKKCNGSNLLIDDYINGHKLFEIGHKEGLMRATEEYIGPDEAADFAAGYLAVCTALSNWWNGIWW